LKRKAVRSVQRPKGEPSQLNALDLRRKKGGKRKKGGVLILACSQEKGFCQGFCCDATGEGQGGFHHSITGEGERGEKKGPRYPFP